MPQTPDINDLRLNSLQPLQLLVDSSSTAGVTYLGKSLPGTLTTAATWKIAKIDTNGDTSMKWADNGAFSQIWADRVSLTYV